MYQELVGVVQAEGNVNAYSDVLAWLRAACTARGGGGPHHLAPCVGHVFPPLHLPPEVHDYIVAKVRSDLPGLAQPPDASTNTTEALVGAIRALTAPRGASATNEEGTPKPLKYFAPIQ